MTLRQHLIDNYTKEELTDCFTHGCSGGFGDFIYYRDTTRYHDKYENEIWDWLEKLREDLGHKSIISLIASFGVSSNVGGIDQFKNLLVWGYVEDMAREIVENKEYKEKQNG